MQAGMMNMWGGLRGRMLVGAGAPPPVAPQEQAPALAGSTAPVAEPEEPPPPIPTIWGDDQGMGSSDADDPTVGWAAEIEGKLTASEPEQRALRDVKVVATDDGKYDIVARYSHAATVVVVGEERVQMSLEKWMAGWAAQVGSYTRSSEFRSRDFRLKNLDTGKTLVLTTSECRSLAGMSESRREAYVESKARVE